MGGDTKGNTDGPSIGSTHPTNPDLPTQMDGLVERFNQILIRTASVGEKD